MHFERFQIALTYFLVVIFDFFFVYALLSSIQFSVSFCNLQ